MRREDKKRRICPYWIDSSKSGSVHFCMATNRGVCQQGDIHNFDNCTFFQNYKKDRGEMVPTTATQPRYPYYLGP